MVIAVPLLVLAAVCYFRGHRQGWEAEKRADTEFNIKQSLRVLRYAESGDITSVIKSSQMYLLGHTRAYGSLVPEHKVPDSFRSTLTNARRVADRVQTNLVVVDPNRLDE